MKTIFLCKTCGVQLSQKLDGPILDDQKIYNDQLDHIPLGTFGICTVDFRIQFKDEYLINLNNKINVQYSEYTSFGCCGYDGLDGRNTLCINGHEVATECSDCWMPHALVFHKDQVVKEVVV